MAAADGDRARRAKPLPFSRGLRTYGSVVASLVGLVALGGVVVSVVHAATFQGPTQSAPGGNIPVTIWNAVSTGGKQANASIDIDGPITANGMAVFGSDSLVVGNTQNLMYGNMDTTSVGNLLLLQNESADMFRVDPVGDLAATGMGVFGSANLVVGSGQNLLYGNMDTTSVGNLLLLQNESADKFRVDKDGNVFASGTVSAASVTSSACFGPTYVGKTSLSYNGNLNLSPGTSKGYNDANTLCVSVYGAGAHVCSAAEILNSIKCAGATSPIRTEVNGTDIWMQDGPPGFTAPANDCQGWQSSASTDKGRKWRMNQTTGGQGFLGTCNESIPLGCCQ